MKNISHLVLAAIVCMTYTTIAPASLTLRFTNENPDYVNTNIYILFTDQPNAPNPFTATSSAGPLALTTAYSLASIGNDGIELSHLWGGVVYVSLGKVMTSNRSDAPSFLNTTDPDYATRWDKFEITYNAQGGDVANLTGINSFAIPFELRTYKTGVLHQSLGYEVDGETMIALLQATATNDSAVLRDTHSNFLRVVGPTAYGAPGIGPYRSFDAYITAVSSTVIRISDLYSGPGTTPRTTTQHYDFTARISENGDMTIIGGSLTPGGIGTNHTIVIDSADLAYHIYANNPIYTVDDTESSFADNDVYAAVVRDVLSGFAIGFVGSAVINPVSGVAFGEDISSNWYAAIQHMAFSDVQPHQPFYNAYAEAFWRYSDTYGFPFSDRLNKPVQAALNPVLVDTLEVVILDDIPEPTAPFIYIAISVWYLRRTHTRAQSTF